MLKIKAFVQGVTAAAVGAIAGAAYTFARRSVTDIPTIAIAGFVFVVLSWKKLPEPLLIVGAAVAGGLIRGSVR